MAENLKTSHYANGTEIDLASSNTDWDQLTNEEGAYCYYNNSASNGAEYGALYNWAAAMNGEDPSFNNPSGVQGVCPDGWHLPSDEEFIEMELYLGMSESEANTFGERGNQGTKLKSITGWDSDGNGTNESGFNALASGYRIQGGQFADLGAETIFITSTIFDDNTIYSRQLSTYGNEVIRVVWYQEMGLSVRCVKN
jgi:uncharacterized protein (TIGR02145 family)